MEKGKSIRREHQHTRGNPKDKEIPKKHDRRVERDHSSSSETDSESEFVKQVEDKLRKRFSKIYPEHPLVKGPLKSPVSAPCLQQSSGSLDCGVIVCYHIETALCHKESKKGEFSAKAAGEYRDKMVSFFVDPIEIVI
ncbi:hypothetical protein ACS0TY_019793 [Phlomoides rotata]